MQLLPDNIGMFLLRLIVYYLVLVILLTVFQNNLLYAPSKYPFQDAISRSRIYGLTLWPEQNERYMGFISGEPEKEFRGTFIVFHGNAGSALDRAYYIQSLNRLGFRVLIMEYPGYGSREGKRGEKLLLNDAKKTIQLASTSSMSPFYLIGESLGAGVATGLAADSAYDIRGLLLITPWNTLPDLAQTKFWFLPARWMCRDQYNNINNLREFRKPVAVVIAEKDRIIPNKLTLAFYNQINSPKKLWCFKNSGHNDWPEVADHEWWMQVVSFLVPRSDS